jgi:hypothetical protein
LKPGENVVTSEHNNNSSRKRSGGERERKYHLEQAQKGGSEAGMKSVVCTHFQMILEAVRERWQFAEQVGSMRAT